jgi:hypothetical protein
MASPAIPMVAANAIAVALCEKLGFLRSSIMFVSPCSEMTRKVLTHLVVEHRLFLQLARQLRPSASTTKRLGVQTLIDTVR